MSKAVTAVGKIVTILESLADDEKQKVLDAVLTLTGLSAPVNQGAVPQVHASAVLNRPAVGSNHGPQGAITAQSYFESKEPKNKIEELAVAARFLEETEGLEEISKDDFARVIKAARRNFDKANFGRDLNNAKTRGLFNKGGSGGVVSLSHAGQGYVDHLPERDVSRLKKRGSVKKTRRSSKKKQGS